VPRAAGMPPNRFAGSNFMPTRLCNFWLKEPQMCHRGMDCSFAHGVQELQPPSAAACGVSRFLHTGMVPTKFCAFFANGTCTRGLACTFAHSPEEMMWAG